MGDGRRLHRRRPGCVLHSSLQVPSPILLLDRVFPFDFMALLDHLPGVATVSGSSSTSGGRSTSIARMVGGRASLHTELIDEIGLSRISTRLTALSLRGHCFNSDLDKAQWLLRRFISSQVLQAQYQQKSYSLRSANHTQPWKLRYRTSKGYISNSPEGLYLHVLHSTEGPGDRIRQRCISRNRDRYGLNLPISLNLKRLSVGRMNWLNNKFHRHHAQSVVAPRSLPYLKRLTTSSVDSGSPVIFTPAEHNFHSSVMLELFSSQLHRPSTFTTVTHLVRPFIVAIVIFSDLKISETGNGVSPLSLLGQHGFDMGFMGFILWHGSRLGLSSLKVLVTYLDSPIRLIEILVGILSSGYYYYGWLVLGSRGILVRLGSLIRPLLVLVGTLYGTFPYVSCWNNGSEMLLGWDRNLVLVAFHGLNSPIRLYMMIHACIVKIASLPKAVYLVGESLVTLDFVCGVILSLGGIVTPGAFQVYLMTSHRLLMKFSMWKNLTSLPLHSTVRESPSCMPLLKRATLPDRVLSDQRPSSRLASSQTALRKAGGLFVAVLYRSTFGECKSSRFAHSDPIEDIVGVHRRWSMPFEGLSYFSYAFVSHVFCLMFNKWFEDSISVDVMKLYMNV